MRWYTHRPRPELSVPVECDGPTISLIAHTDTPPCKWVPDASSGLILYAEVIFRLSKRGRHLWFGRRCDSTFGMYKLSSWDMKKSTCDCWSKFCSNLNLILSLKLYFVFGNVFMLEPMHRVSFSCLSRMIVPHCCIPSSVFSCWFSLAAASYPPPLLGSGPRYASDPSVPVALVVTRSACRGTTS